MENWYFFHRSTKTIVDHHQNCYIDLLKTSLLPECRSLYPGNDFVFIQLDSAPSHRAEATQQFLRQNTPVFIGLAALC